MVEVHEVANATFIGPRPCGPLIGPISSFSDFLCLFWPFPCEGPIVFVKVNFVVSL